VIFLGREGGQGQSVDPAFGQFLGQQGMDDTVTLDPAFAAEDIGHHHQGEVGFLAGMSTVTGMTGGLVPDIEPGRGKALLKLLAEAGGNAHGRPLFCH